MGLATIREASGSHERVRLRDGLAYVGSKLARGSGRCQSEAGARKVSVS